MELPINDKELDTILSALRLGGTTWNLLNYKRNTKSHKGYRAVPQQS